MLKWTTEHSSTEKEQQIDCYLGLKHYSENFRKMHKNKVITKQRIWKGF